MSQVSYAIVQGATARRKRRSYGSICTQLQAAGIESIELTRSPGDTPRLVAEACAQGVQQLVVVGGDGTLHEVVNALMQWDGKVPALTLIPFGTGSDFARSLKRSLGLRAVAEVVREPKVIAMDVGRLEYQGGECWFINVASCGLTGSVARFVHQRPRFKRLFGSFSYLLAAFVEVARFRPFRLQWQRDGESLQARELMFLVCANGSYFGGAVCIAPQASTQDGLLNIIAVRKTPKWWLAMRSLFYRQGWHSRFAEVEHGTFRALDFHQAGVLDMECDGEPIRAVPKRISIHPKALTLWL